MVTFLEDALRIITQWSDQLIYLHDYRHSMLSLSSDIRVLLLTELFTTVPTGLTHLFLIINVIAMTVCSFMIIVRKNSDYGVGGLIGVVILQGIGYGLVFDLNFFLRNLSVMGGLLMVLSDSWVRKRFAPAGLPQIDEKDRKMYFQLAGRILLIFLFVGFVFRGDWNFWRILVSILGFGACVMVVVGFKAKWSAIMLVVILSIFNVLVNNFWTVCFTGTLLLSKGVIWLEKANVSYSFILTTHTRILPSTTSSRSCLLCKSQGITKSNKEQLLICCSGGLLLLVNMGPGQFSVDEKKKVY